MIFRQMATAAPPSHPDVRWRDRAIVRTLPLMPRRLVRRFARTYIAGERIEEALHTVSALHARGAVTTLDVLGEAVRTDAVARQTAAEYHRALDSLHGLGDPDLVNVSLKLTGLGQLVSMELCRELVTGIVEHAARLGGFVRIDMEDSPYTDDTLALFFELRDAGFDNVGVVLQSCLQRSLDDARALARVRARVRVVKGIYHEPEAIAFHDPERVRAEYLAIADLLMSEGCATALATHDTALVEAGRELVARHGGADAGHEFQMLLGVREGLRDELIGAGHTERVYVPYGALWYEYSLRRLRENPKIAGYVARDVLRRRG
jgi:proline dehydrogenase